jgi:recombination protein RecA
MPKAVRTNTPKGPAPATEAEKDAVLAEVVARMDKNFGTGSVMRMGDHPSQTVETISTGSLALDIALGGGLPRGRIVESFGNEGSGKSTLALHCIAEAQKAGGVAAYVDAEQAMDARYAASLGVNVDKLYLSQPSCGEQCLEIADNMVRSGVVDIVVIDSVAALTPRAELEGEMGDQSMGLMARMMGQGCRKLASSVGTANAVLIFINQIRDKIGVTWGDPTITPGGRALKFFASVRMKVARIEAIKDASGHQIGARTKVSIVKNKVACPFVDSEFDLIYGKGINKAADILDVAVAYGVIQRAGAFYTIGAEKVQGRENAVVYLSEHDSIADELRAAVLAKVGEPCS